MSGLFFHQLGIPEPDVKLVHVEAGLRSFDRPMPEEINRLLTDSISDPLFCTEQSGVDNLRNEDDPDVLAGLLDAAERIAGILTEQLA